MVISDKISIDKGSWSVQRLKWTIACGDDDEDDGENTDGGDGDGEDNDGRDGDDDGEDNDEGEGG